MTVLKYPQISQTNCKNTSAFLFNSLKANKFKNYVNFNVNVNSIFFLRDYYIQHTIYLYLYIIPILKFVRKKGLMFIN